ncbi:MAG: DnaJ domain-containing protein [Prevotella sp.]|nr:DnaJ domain-containing protein [Prevotella sp.]
MAFGKWIGGALGFMTGGPLGALAGYVLGSIFDVALDGFSEDGENQSHDRAGFGSESANYREYAGNQRVDTGNRNSFLFSILVLASYIIRADGKIMHSEMEYVRNFLRGNFGSSAVQQGEQILRKLFDEQKRMDAQNPGAYENMVMQSCGQIALHLPQEQCLQLLAFLAEIARADGIVVSQEKSALYEIARAMRLSEKEVDSMLNLGEGSTHLDAAYKVLELSPDATDEEVKSAYRKMALKHHPDRVATLGEDVRKASEKKFQEINAAKDLIYKSRGL